jgi:uncharacterized protein DUF1298
VPLGGSVRIGVAIFSYDGGINFGVTGDRDSAADIDVLCAGIEHGIADLLEAGSSKSRDAASDQDVKSARGAQPGAPVTAAG